MNVQVETLRPVLIGDKVHPEKTQLELPADLAKRLSRAKRPAVRLLEGTNPFTRTVQQPPVLAQSGASFSQVPASQPPQMQNPTVNPGAQPSQPGTEGKPASPLTAEELVAAGVPAKVAKILVDAGIQRGQEQTKEGLMQIEGVGEKTADLVLGLLQK